MKKIDDKQSKVIALLSVIFCLVPFLLLLRRHVSPDFELIEPMWLIGVLCAFHAAYRRSKWWLLSLLPLIGGFAIIYYGMKTADFIGP